MGRISLDFFRRKSHDEGPQRRDGERAAGIPESDARRPDVRLKQDLGLMIDHKKDRAIMDDAREEVPVVKKEEERDEEQRTQPRRKSAELERKDSANVRKVQVL